MKKTHSHNIINDPSVAWTVYVLNIQGQNSLFFSAYSYSISFVIFFPESDHLSAGGSLF